MAVNELSLIIPAHNEDKRILHTLNVYTKFFGDLINKLEILVVCNNCSDATPEIVADFSKKHKEVRAINILERIGKGGAVIAGLKEAKHKYCGFIDADDAFELEDLKKLIKALDDSDVAIASKWKEKNFLQVREPFIRKILSRGWNFLVKSALDLDFSDTQAGAKFFTKNAFDSIDQNFLCKGFEFDVELLWKFKKKKFKITEVPARTKHMPGSSFRIKNIIYMFGKLVTLYKLSRKLK